ncbi:unnamed protein product [Pleuronectes platessa]|uniref:Uncharacterized protein n=1 Tax=Pleuronectes platessa TaxID=8262 RepID=A0A9N7YME9_PLEPL|nr:unnamed protein product [Pleuronectes platessa]
MAVRGQDTNGQAGQWWWQMHRCDEGQISQHTKTITQDTVLLPGVCAANTVCVRAWGRGEDWTQNKGRTENRHPQDSTTQCGPGRTAARRENEGGRRPAKTHREQPRRRGGKPQERATASNLRADMGNLGSQNLQREQKAITQKAEPRCVHECTSGNPQEALTAGDRTLSGRRSVSEWVACVCQRVGHRPQRGCGGGPRVRHGAGSNRRHTQLGGHKGGMENLGASYHSNTAIQL